MTDEERAEAVVTEYESEFDVFGGMKTKDATVGREMLMAHIAAAFAAIREECATVARDMARQVAMGQRDHATGFDISDAILRTAQPVKAQEGA
jgi:hypothetical protein